MYGETTVSNKKTVYEKMWLERMHQAKSVIIKGSNLEEETALMSFIWAITFVTNISVPPQ